MKKFIILTILFLLLMPAIYWVGYLEGSSNQKGLDAPSKARLVSRIAELYENKDERAHVLMYTYLNTELALYEDYLNFGNSFAAQNTFHESFIKKNKEHLEKIAIFIHSTNDGKNKYKNEIAEQLERMGYSKQ